MIIKSVRLENIRSYTNQEIVFPDGSVLLSGDIGSGKSTVLFAIEFAFFGVRRKHLSGESLLRNGKNTGSVELKFEVDGKEILVKRSLKRGKGEVKQESGYVVIDGVKKEATPVELKTIILDILGYPKELVSKSKTLVYRYTVYTPQEEMKQILTEDKDNRLDTLRKVFGIDKYKRVRENCVLFTRFLRENRSRLEGQTIDIEDKKKALNENEEQMKGLKDNLESVKEKFERIAAEIQIVENEMIDKENNVKKINELKREYEVNEAKLNQKIELYSKDKERLKELEEKVIEIKNKASKIKAEEFKNKEEDVEKAVLEKERALHSAMENTASIREELASVMTNIDEIKRSIAENSKVDSELKKNKELLLVKVQKVNGKDDLRNEITACESMMNEITAQIKSYEDNKEQSSSVKSKITELENCPTCYQPVSSEHKQHIHKIESDKIDAYVKKIKGNLKEKEEKQKELLRLKAEFDKIIDGEKEIERLNAENRNLELKSKEITDKMIKLNKYIEKKDELNSKIVKKEEIELLKKKVDELKELLRKIRANNQLLKEKQYLDEMLKQHEERISELTALRDNVKKEIGEMNSKKLELNEEVKKFNDAEEFFLKAKEKFNDLKEKGKDAEVSRASLEKETESLGKVINLLNEEILKKENAKKKLVYQNELHNWLNEYFVNLMSVMERNVLSRIYNEFNELFVKWFNMLVEDEMMNARLDEEFTPVIEQDGYETPIENMSGGERTACALAYRLALNKVINDVMSRIKTNDVIILDEPTDGFSSEQLDKMRDVMDELKVKQTIIVSHEAKIETYVDHVIKIKKDEHISAVAEL